ncbi:MAG: DUF1501 domain-containing protein, partial [Planctomycetales bacterium]
MGFGSLALADLMIRDATAVPAARHPLAPKQPHFPPRATNVIFLYMDGGVSQVDTFDPKPLLTKENGNSPKFKIDATVFNNHGNLLKSPWKFD